MISSKSIAVDLIVFCRSISTCTNLYKLFICVLKEESYHPLGSPPTTENRIFAMFHARIDEDDKKTILKSLVQSDGICRVVFCTIAFGMGVDVPNVRTVIHYGPSTDISRRVDVLAGMVNLVRLLFFSILAAYLGM